MTPRELFDTLVYEAGKTRFELLRIIYSISYNLPLPLLKFFISEFKEIGSEYEKEDIHYKEIVNFDPDLLTWKIHNRGSSYKGWQILEEYGVKTFESGNDNKDEKESHLPYNYDFVLSRLIERLNEPEGETDGEDTTQYPGLPPDLDTERARKYFARAVEVGYMKPTSTGYKWEFGGTHGAKARLAYFVERVYCPTATDKIRADIIKPLQQLFEAERLDRAIQQNADSGKTKAVKEWRAEIDKNIFGD